METESQILISMMDGYKKSFILAAATKLDLFNTIHSQFSDIQSLASFYQIHPQSMQTFIRALEVLGLVVVTEGIVDLTSLGKAAQSDPALKNYLVISSKSWIDDWSHLVEVLIHGKESDGSSWDRRAKNPQVDLAFHRFMVDSQATPPPINLDHGKVVDLGGGLGCTLAHILKSNPYLNGVLFDLPHVIEEAKHHFLKEFRSRCQFIAGSFLEKIPSDGDVYLLNNILHDWNDEYAKKILTNSYEAMQPGSRLIIAETFIPEEENNDQATFEYATLTDLHLMLVHGGRKRTSREYQSILSHVGFTIVSLTPDCIEVQR